MLTSMLLICIVLIMVSHLPSSLSMKPKSQLRFSSSPYLTRHLSSCEDTNESFEVLFPTRVRSRNCQWVAENTKRRCMREEAMEKCPRTCNTCKTSTPTSSSSAYPTTSVSAAPSTSPTMNESLNPSTKPTLSIAPSLSSAPTKNGSQHPTNNPSFAPTFLPSRTASNSPTILGTFSPSISQNPSLSTSSFPTILPSQHDSYTPTTLSRPSISPSSEPNTVVQGSLKNQGSSAQVVDSRNMYTFIGVIAVGCVFISLLIILFVKQRYDKKHKDFRSIKGTQSQDPYVSRLVYKNQSLEKMELTSTETNSTSLKTTSESKVEELEAAKEKEMGQISQMANDERESNPVLVTSLDEISLSFGSFNASVLSATDEESAYQKEKHDGKNGSNYQDHFDDPSVGSPQSLQQKDTLDLIMASHQIALESNSHETEGQKPENEHRFDASQILDENGESSVFGQSHIFEFECPPGPMGLIIQSTGDKGPVVNDVKATSPLLGVIIPGDVIIQVNNIETMSMTGHELKIFLGNRSLLNHHRGVKLTVMRDPEV